MATFTNRATLSYNGNITNSNTVTGELVEVLSATKNAVSTDYTAGDRTTYVISIVNSGTAAFTGLTVSDNLGAYTYNSSTLTPLEYVAGSVRYYINGVLQAAPAVNIGPPLAISGISVPGGGNAIIIYEADVNAYAPLGADASISNTATISGGGISTPIEASETTTAINSARLTVNKSVNPTTVTENGQITYTFVIQNSGSVASASDNIVLSDTFDPVLNSISVNLNGTPWTASRNYTYNEATGEFATISGQITVPAATYAQNTDGTWTITPGTATLTITGTI